MSQINENTVEEAALSWFGELGYAIAHGEQIAPDEPGAERESYGDVVLIGRLRDAIDRLNPDIPAQAREEALRKVMRPYLSPGTSKPTTCGHFKTDSHVNVQCDVTFFPMDGKSCRRVAA